MTMPLIVGLCGMAGAGKDTAASWFVERGYQARSFAAPIKEMLNQAFGWSMGDWEDRAWKEGFVGDVLDSSYTHSRSLSPRSLAQWLGTDVVRNNFGEGAWIQVLARRLMAQDWPRTVITDVRMQNEVDWINDSGGQVIRITRPGTGAGPQHVTERTHTLYGISHEVRNDSTIPELYERLSALWTTS